ncbi:MAG: hypothetical protein IJA34_02450 [Lachnospiraceae bacterium]|nr:hypothetical protein [Lachnospiraceae bacterium]
MFNLSSTLIYIINSIFSGLFTSRFLKSKRNKKITIILWSFVYFIAQLVIFDVIQNYYQFNNMLGDVINLLLLAGMQWMFFSKGASCQLFVCFSFVAGKEIVTDSQVVAATNMMTYVMDFFSVFLILPSIVAICISITLKMMIVTVENGITTLIYDTVPDSFIAKMSSLSSTISSVSGFDMKA